MFKSWSQLIPQVLEFDNLKSGCFNQGYALIWFVSTTFRFPWYRRAYNFALISVNSYYVSLTPRYCEQALNTLDAGRYSFHHRSAALASSLRRADLRQACRWWSYVGLPRLNFQPDLQKSVTTAPPTSSEYHTLHHVKPRIAAPPNLNLIRPKKGPDLCDEERCQKSPKLTAQLSWVSIKGGSKRWLHETHKKECRVQEGVRTLLCEGDGEQLHQGFQGWDKSLFFERLQSEKDWNKLPVFVLDMEKRASWSWRVKHWVYICFLKKIVLLKFWCSCSFLTPAPLPSAFLARSRVTLPAHDTTPQPGISKSATLWIYTTLSAASH